MDNTTLQERARAVVNARNYRNMVPPGEHPQPGEYLITGLQPGNFHGEAGWHKYIGYVVQIRKNAGAFGSHMILLRHPDGSLVRHENQDYCRIAEPWLTEAKALYPEGMTPEGYEDYSLPYNLGQGSYPEFGPIVEAKLDGPVPDNSPSVQITVSGADGSREIIVV